MITAIIAAVVALAIGTGCGYWIFRNFVNGKYKEMMATAEKESEVLKEKKLLEVKEKDPTEREQTEAA